MRFQQLHLNNLQAIETNIIINLCIASQIPKANTLHSEKPYLNLYNLEIQYCARTLLPKLRKDINIKASLLILSWDPSNKNKSVKMFKGNGFKIKIIIIIKSSKMMQLLQLRIRIKRILI